MTKKDNFIIKENLIPYRIRNYKVQENTQKTWHEDC
jgi:hypothetical protein